MNILLHKQTAEAKQYPYWDKLDLNGHQVKEIDRIMSLDELKFMVEWCDLFISVDSFLPHFVKAYGFDKKGIVLWGVSDPLLFGYKDFTNLLKDRKYLREKQYWIWKDEVWNKEVFVDPEEVNKVINSFCQV